MLVKRIFVSLFFVTLVSFLGSSIGNAQDTEVTRLTPLRTNIAKESFLGVAHRGDLFLVSELRSLPSGERFIHAKDSKSNADLGWIQVYSGESVAVGATIVLASARYRFSQPVVEEEDEQEYLSNLENELTDLSAYELNTREHSMANACNNFIKSDGTFGPWGEYIIKTLDEKEYSALFSESVEDAANICPKFSQMNTDEKKEFWVWFLAAMANQESGCRTSVQAKGVNGTAAGLLQLHLGKETAYGCKGGTNSLEANDNLECGLHILNRDIQRTNNWYPRKNNYWDVLRWPRPAAKKTIKIVKAYGPCK